MATVSITVDDALLKLADDRAARSRMDREGVLADALRRGLGEGRLAEFVDAHLKDGGLSADEAMVLANSELKAMRAERRSA